MTQPTGTLIKDIPEGEHRERLRREIMNIVESRSEQETSALNRLVTFMGLVCSGATIAILSFVGQLSKGAVPLSAIISFMCSATALLSFAIMLYVQFQLHSKRWSDYASLAEAFFTRQASLEDVIEGGHANQSKWPYRLLFWFPFSFLVATFVFGAVAVLEARASHASAIAPMVMQPQKQAAPTKSVR